MSKHDQAQALWGDGYSYTEIAALLDVARTTARCWVDPSQRERQRQHHRDWWHRTGGYQRKLRTAGVSP